MKVIIYDSQFLSSAGIQSVLKNYLESSEVEILNAEKRILPQLRDQSADLLILEYLGRHTVSFEHLKEIRKSYPKLKILIISEDDDTIEIKKRIALGVEGFLTKKCSLEEIRLTIDMIFKGGRFYCKRIIDIISDHEHAMSVELSERELQIIQMISKGTPSLQMAEKLNLSIHTINSHRKNILKKLGFKSPAELIAYAVKKVS
uniref:LuxR C-terminal-related transcriptional regulator n=2 Tax=Roseivirga sp. TaxID=1964215 RepID=UPI004048C839